jgi:signal transduction histidine kinase
LSLPLAVVDPGVGPGTQQAGVEEQVRRLVARELHDRVAQTLTGMLVEVENFKSEQVGWEEVVHQLDVIQGSTREVLASIRQLLHDLRGEEAQRGSFVETVRALVARFEAKAGIAVRVDVGERWPQALNSAASLNLYRIIEEALANVRMHSGARNVQIVLDEHSENEVSLRISDDGRGVDSDPTRVVGLGTIGMRERAVFLGGQLRVEGELGHGTVVQATFPKRLLAVEPTAMPETIALPRRITR